MDYRHILNRYRSNVRSYSRQLKSLEKIKGSRLDNAFEDEHHSVFEEIDCLKCANCCKTISPIFKNSDINRIAKSLGLKPPKFIENYLNLDEEGDYVLKNTPCPFLGPDNMCAIYDCRPTACRQYPHTNHRNMKSHLKLLKKNLNVCPAAVEILDRISKSKK